jgi:hypothetical protein
MHSKVSLRGKKRGVVAHGAFSRPYGREFVDLPSRIQSEEN